LTCGASTAKSKDLLIGVALAKLPIGFSGQKMMTLVPQEILTFTKYHESTFGTATPWSHVLSPYHFL